MDLTVNDASACKIMRVSLSSTASASPCSCTGPLSSGTSLSGSCLTCTEQDFSDIDLQDVDGFSDDPQEFCGSCSSDCRFDCVHGVKDPISAELSRLIRDDLAKQRDPTVKPAGSASGAAGPASVRRLPAQHRALIVGWMRQVTAALRLQPSTLFTATSILDRFVAAAEAPPADGLLQLLALTCMSVAVKYNEVGQVAPAVWLGLALDPTGRHLYSTRDLQQYEFTLLQTIQWRLHQPNTFSFLEHFLMCCQKQPHACGRSHPTCTHPAPTAAALAEAEAVSAAVTAGPVGSRAALLAELTLLYDTFLSYDSSTVAMACLLQAERLAAVSSAVSAVRLPPLLPAPLAVALVTGLKPDAVAPGLEACIDTLERCCGSAVC